MTTFRQLGEREVIRRLARLVPDRADVRVGIGDDVAVVGHAGAYDLLLTSDAVIENTHFLPDAPPESIGHKAIGRVLSDFAAMGGEPLWALVDLVAPAETPVEWAESVYRGAARLAARFHLAIVGGDTTGGPVRELHVFGVGRLPAGEAVLRSGARPGDVLYVTGALGGSLAGRHLDFEPRVAEGAWLREGRWATAMMDISDGLLVDLERMLERSRAGAELQSQRVPVAPDALAAKDGRSPLEHALGDGEDYELLFAVPAARVADFEAAWKARFKLPCSSVGTITAEPGRLVLRDRTGRVLTPGRAGYEHFA
ncbi:MAG TPA: thiamine-phosphate kinase [Kiritimatiellia bacterium]|nr:thiamine-phosphate kinase [Kiritimatiellia bacterium]HRZ12930.1 thiamine-phosphate kinase [Kiritimatiellia bacterium]HSA18460.1 thiamine-phosphate kinase [Kiritimatiellia bacterium]